ncbi:cupin domain-containing protein [Pontibacillus marinus]|uniref:Cupin n=1 Tax=Pontibacillus marinus BH030004 = DSM 16465 TaxID=1385511 RepID=A0A0A5GFL7_9BACI|nr:cupin domain-containing protein [Pontibacillus marinus]KGX90814.1 cupin [Pontibacillus marinus BH030004 = DSM 16465]
MYYEPGTYPYYVQQPNVMPRNHQGAEEQISEAIRSSIQREASTMDVYHRLAQMAPDENHQNHILQSLENKRAHVNQFTDLYVNLTGTQPTYQIEQVPFNNYQEGLQRAYEAEVAGYEEYQNSLLLTQHPLVQNVFHWALNNESDHATRLGNLNREARKDYGGEPYVVNIEKATVKNKNFRKAIWTGEHLQVTLMSIQPGDDIGLEVHDVDQFLRVEGGKGLVQMGDRKNNLTFEKKVKDDYAIMVPSGKWHNLTNTGDEPLKIYSIYAPPEHPKGTVHRTKAEALAAEE